MELLIYIGYALMFSIVLFFLHKSVKFFDPEFRERLLNESLDMDFNRPRMKDSLSGALIISYTVLPDRTMSYDQFLAENKPKAISYAEFESNIRSALSHIYFNESLPPGLKLGKISKRVRI